MFRFIVRSLPLVLILAARTLAADELVTARLLASTDAAVPGATFIIGVHLKMKSGWHTYWINPGESGEATRIKLTGPDGFEFGAIQWPLPHRLEAPGGFSYGYEGDVLLMVPVRVSKDVAAGTAAKLTATVSWLACKEECIEGSAALALDLPIAAASRPANTDAFKAWQGKLPAKLEAADGAKAPLTVEQIKNAAGEIQNELHMHWKEMPAKVEWFPIVSPAVAIEDVKLTSDGGVTRIEFKSKVFKAQAQGSRLDSVLVYEDKSGRHGVSVPFEIVK